MRLRELIAGNYEEPNTPRVAEQFDSTDETYPWPEVERVDFEESVIVFGEDDEHKLLNYF